MKVLLLCKDAVFLADTGRKLHTQYGEIDLAKATVGKKIKSNKGKEFCVVMPTIIDLLKKAKRGPQIITPKDAAAIASVTGVSSGWRCLDAGSGSGFLAAFLGNIVKPKGRVHTYETKKENYELVRKNIKHCGLENIVSAECKDVRRSSKKNLDLITLDMQDAEKTVKHVSKALKSGGWLCVYSPHIEQQIKVAKAMEKEGFAHIKTIENIQREWKVDTRGFTHPRHSQVVHTGFITFGRKV